MKFSRIKLNRIRKENVMYVNGGHVILVVNIWKSSLTMEETFLDKGILEKLTKKEKVWPFIQLPKKMKP